MTKPVYKLVEAENGGFLFESLSSFPGCTGNLIGAFTDASDFIKFFANEHEVQIDQNTKTAEAPIWTMNPGAILPDSVKDCEIIVIWSDGVETYPAKGASFRSAWGRVVAYRIVKNAPAMQAPPAPPMQPAPWQS